MSHLVFFTLVYELSPLTGWTGYVRELPLLGQVQHFQLQEVQQQVSLRLVEIVRAMPGKQDIRIRSEFYYRHRPGY